MPTKNTSTITARVPNEVKEEVNKACEQAGISKSEYINKLITLPDETKESLQDARKNPVSEQGESDENFALGIALTVGAVAGLNMLNRYLNNQENDNGFTRG